MRNFGAVLVLLGILGFFYATSRLGEAAPLPEGISVTEGLDQPAGRWEMARYGCAAVAGFGLLMAMFPKGR
ncbi:MAG TPA: hypothetical protein VE359_11745 [Vicinamibacteria bacterium]|nr:hypothetical protein [Vicinamibacteria bacterium]